jgi:hypothetical protein
MDYGENGDKGEHGGRGVQITRSITRNVLSICCHCRTEGPDMFGGHNLFLPKWVCHRLFYSIGGFVLFQLIIMKCYHPYFMIHISHTK